MKCQYCERTAFLVRFGDPAYPYERRDYGPSWVCLPCEAWCGCHPNTEKPLGMLANAELRRARRIAHAVFDPLWKREVDAGTSTKSHARRRAYRWLADQLGISARRTHMGHFDLPTCVRVAEICKPMTALPAPEEATA